MNNIDPRQYDGQLADKKTHIQALFSDLYGGDIEVFPSPPLHYRMRAEFRIWHQGENSYYAMTPPGGGQPQPVEEFPIGSKSMVAIMPPLLKAITGQPELRRKLFACEFLTTLSGEVLVTLIYHRPLDDSWECLARDMAKELGIALVGRSRKQKIVLSQDYVTETLTVAGASYHYRQVETGFTQPNASVNEKMLSWAKEVTRKSEGDLLELYCGNGNFTVVLSENFDKVLATEVSKISVQSAQVNLRANAVSNVVVVRMSSEELSDALKGVRLFRRLKAINLDDYKLSTLFVDPPRAGLDDNTLELAKRFDQILYISCNPLSLKENIDYLKQSHDIDRFALFDQFPYTHHIECGVLLKRRDR